MLKRRTFLKQLGTIFVALGFVRCFGADGTLSSEKALFQLVSNEAFASLGAVALANRNHLNLVRDDLVVQLLQGLERQNISANDLKEFFVRQIAEDYTSGAVEIVEHWLLSKTEINLAMVAAL